MLELRENRRLLATIANNFGQLAPMAHVSADAPARESRSAAGIEVFG